MNRTLRQQGGVALLAVLGCASVQAGDWQPVAESDRKQVFVNAASLSRTGDVVQAAVKENFTAPQPSAKKDRSFSSSRTVYRFDCVQRRVAIKSIRAHAGTELQGEVVQKAEFGDKNLQWMDAPDGTVFAALLDYVCK